MKKGERKAVVNKGQPERGSVMVRGHAKEGSEERSR